jgi:hypothetical protein
MIYNIETEDQHLNTKKQLKNNLSHIIDKTDHFLSIKLVEKYLQVKYVQAHHRIIL